MNKIAEQAKSIFLNALECDRGDVANYLTEACVKERELRHDVEVLLEGHRQGNDLAERAIAACDEALPTEMRDTVAIRTGAHIGPYKIREKIGEGGMGVVYVAEQTEPVQRKVALKIIKPGMDTKEVIARFAAERLRSAIMAPLGPRFASRSINT